MRPVRRGRLTGPDGAGLARGLVAKGDDQVHVWRRGQAVFVPALAAQALGRQARTLERFDGAGIGLAVRRGCMARGMREEAALAEMIEQRLRDQAARRIAVAEEEDVNGVAGVHGLAKVAVRRQPSGGRLCALIPTQMTRV